MRAAVDTTGEVPMRGIAVILVFTSAALAEEPRFAERSPPPHLPKTHTADDAGINRPVKRALPGMTPHKVLGYTNETTFGMDYTLFSGRKPGVVSPGLWPWGRKPVSYSSQYATEPRFHIPDLFALQPYRRAVKEANAEKATHEEKP